MPDEMAERQYQVVVNDEEQYSIWPVELDCPGGWRLVAVTGDRRTCLDHIERTWTDMRPRSLRERMSRVRAG
jgi:MbtH protein